MWIHTQCGKQVWISGLHQATWALHEFSPCHWGKRFHPWNDFFVNKGGCKILQTYLHAIIQVLFELNFLIALPL